VSAIEDWLKILLPCGKGWLVVYNLCADESFDGADGNFTVAGYLVGSKALVRLIEAWALALGPLDYFHMKEGHHHKHPEIYKQLLSLMTPDYLTAGFAASVNQAEYRNVMSEKLRGQSLRYWFGGPYSFCVGAIADLANKWLNANNPNERNIAYVFESGHENQGEADTHLQQINSHPALISRKRELRYYSHTFKDGKRKDSGILHAADILAWHMGKARRAEPTGFSTSVDIYTVEYPENNIRETVAQQLELCSFYGNLTHATVLRPPSAGQI